MTVTISQVRTAINIQEEGDLADDVFELNLSRAQTKVDAVARSDVSEALKDDAILSLAAFYSYRSYADRIRHRVEGSYQKGRFTPTQDTRVRDTSAKLESLRRDSQEGLRMVRPRIGRIV